MTNNELTFSENNELESKHIKIIDIDKVDDYLFIILDNGQKILTNGKDLYNLSDYDHLSRMFNMGDKFCAVMIKGYSKSVVDLKTMAILFESKKAYHISKQDDRTLHIIMEIGYGNDAIYDIETKKYLPAPDNYEFEYSLGNNLYVFREQNKSDKNFYDLKRCVINADGKIIFKDIDGWIELSNNCLIITKKNKLCDVKINENSTLDIKTIEQNEKIIAKPTYHNGNIIIMEQGIIKLYTPDFELVKEFIVDELKTVIDYQIVSDTLKLCLPYTLDGEQINKHVFINLNTGKIISHIRIDGYPYWEPTTYIGRDSIDSEVTNYHFYNAEFSPIISVPDSSYESVGSERECMYVIKTTNGEHERKQLINTENGSIRDVDYDYIYFHNSLPYGYGVNFSTEKMDFFDENLNIIILDFDYKKFNLNFYKDEFGYFIINDYICIYKHFIDGFGLSRWRTIIQKANGEVILDSIKHKCYAIGNFIQIIHNEDSEFLNTITGEIGSLEIKATIDENGKIDFKKINNIDNILTIEDNIQLELLPTKDEKSPKRIDKNKRL